MPARRSRGNAQLADLFRAIAADPRSASQLLRAHPEWATQALTAGASRQESAEYFIEAIKHYMYAGDTALHIAAAAYRTELVHDLVALGANVGAANRRRQQPLHYAVDGGPGSPHWDPRAQVATIRALVGAGANPNAVDAGGVTPLHRAVRNRCAAAVEVLLELGADAERTNKAGSTPAALAKRTTGHSGSGAPEAKTQQAAIQAKLASLRGRRGARTSASAQCFELRQLGIVRSTLTQRSQAPRQGREGAPDAWIEFVPGVLDALDGLRVGEDVIVITWLHVANRETLKVHPRNNRKARLFGVFATRSPDRPNPLGLHRVTVREIDGPRLRVGPLEAIDGTPVVDVKITLGNVDDA